MSYLVDTNVLLRSIQPTHPMYIDAARALKSLSGQGEHLCIIPQNLIEFWAVATRQIANNGLGLTIAQAAQEIVRMKIFFDLLPDNQAIFAKWEKLVVQYQVIGKPTHDARLVAAMLQHKLSHILTFNTADFKRFNGIVAVEPSVVR